MVVPYTQRKSLSADERRAISHYKDIKNPQCKWDYKLDCKTKSTGIDCYMINNFMRGNIKTKDLSPRDWIQLNELIMNIRTAILKCTIKKPILVYRGLSNPSWFLKKKVGEYIYDKAFMSFSESKYIAEKYAMKNDVKNPVLLLYVLKPNDKALYIDNDEREYLVGHPSSFKIIGMKQHRFPDGRIGSVYYLGSTK